MTNQLAEPLDLRSDRYQLREELGRGGMGVVYRAFDRELGAEVALKTVPRPDAGDVYQLKQEFRALLDIQHRNLVELFDLVAGGEACFFTMELLDAVDFLTFARGASLEALRGATEQLLLGLDALHRGGVVHRDLKPSNILVTREGRVVILDFGLAGVLRNYGKPGHDEAQTFVGTPAYVAPEQSWSGAVGPAADLYSAGVVLYQALSGSLPFDGDPAAILADKWKRPPRPIDELVPSIPADLRDLVAALLQRPPDARPTARKALALMGKASVDADPPAQDGPAPAPPLVGRERELEALERAFSALEPGSRCAVLKVYGPSGVGKSTLIQRFVEAASAREDTLVLAGRCHPNEAVPYKALDAVMDDLTAALCAFPEREGHRLGVPHVGPLIRLFPVMAQIPWLAASPDSDAGASPAELRRRGVEALRTLLAGLARARRIVLWIDDVQWGDRDSAVLIRELLQSIGPARLLLLLSYRTSEQSQSPVLDELAHLAADHPGAARIDELALPPLGDEDARRLLSLALAGAAIDPARVEAIVRQAQGTPYLLCEVAELHREGAADGGDGRPAGESDLDEVFRRRLDRFPAEAQTMLEVVSLAGGPLARDAMLLAAGAGQRGPRLLATLQKAKLLRHGASGEASVQVFHDRIRDALLQSLAPEGRRTLHGRLAGALEETGCPDLGLLATHHAGAGNRDRAAGFARRAADQSMSALAFERGARFYEMALELGPGPPGAAAEIQALLGHANAAAGRTTSAATWLLRAADALPGEIALQHRQHAAELLIGGGHLDRGREVLKSVLRGVDMRLPARTWSALATAAYLRARLKARGLAFTERPRDRIPAELLARIDVCWTVAGSLGFFDAVSAFGFQTRHLLLALDSGDISCIARALAMELVYVDTTGGKLREVDELERALAPLAARLTSPDEQAFLLLARGFRQLHAGRFGEALDTLSRADRLYAPLRAARWERSLCRTHRVFALVLSGRLPEAATAEARLSAELLIDDDVSSASNLGLLAGYNAELAADRPERARERVESALRPWASSLPLSFEFLAVVAGARIELYEGRSRAALERLERAWKRLRPIHAYQSERIMLHWQRGLAALSAGGAREVRVAVEASKRIDAERMPWSAGLASTLSAGASLSTGDRAGALRRLTQAIAEFTTAEMPLDAAAVQWWRGRLEGGDAGARRASDAEGALRELGVTSPERWVRLHAPVALR